jgi:tRNA threonylcarbamoyl adenosine modification protein YeaZ
MIVLAFDLAIGHLSIACLNHKTAEYAESFYDSNPNNSNIFIPAIDETLKKIQMTIQDVDIIAVTRGPGSFTGTRLGLIAAQSLGLSLGKPVLGFSTLQVLSWINPLENAGKTVTCVVSTKRDDFFVQSFRVGEATDSIHIISEDELNARQELHKKDVSAPQIISTQTLNMNIFCKRVVEIIECGRGSEFENLEPIYIRDAEVSQSKQKIMPLGNF